MLPQMTMTISNTSTLQMPASEVFRLSVSSLTEIEQIRKRAVREVLEELSHQYVRYGPLGMFKRPRFKSAEEALQNAPEIEFAQLKAYADYDTCMELQKAAKYLMENVGGESLMTITLNDFRALT